MYEVGGRKQLFIDDRFIVSQQGLTRRMNPPVKAEPMLTPETEIESGSISGYTSILQDPEVKGRYLMYYTVHTKETEEAVRHVCRAVSEDGLYWERERVGIVEIEGSRDNNVVVSGISDNATVFLDPKASPRQRFKLLVTRYWMDPNKSGLYLYTSADGLHWTFHPTRLLPFFSDTLNQVFYDTRLDKYVAYLRLWNPPGTYSVRSRRQVGRCEMNDVLQPWPYTAAQKPNFLWGEDKIPAMSTEVPTVIESDETDPPATDIYTPGVHLYPYADDLYVAFPSVFRHYDGYDPHGRDHRDKLILDGTLDIQLAVSRDGIHFTRFRTPYVGLGRIGEVDGGALYMGSGMIRHGDDLDQYYAAYPTTHGIYGEVGAEFRRGLPREAIIRAVQRLDGFVSVDAGPEGGELTTPVITFEGTRLQLNIDCSAIGEAWVELQDENSQPIPGFSESEAVSVDRNSVAQEVWWHNGPDVSSLAGRPIKMRIRMRSAKLFAFQFVQ